jgi:quercetin dioxygenase-like cupin family protein
MRANGQIIRAEGEGEKRWFYGGGLHTWKATAAETGGALIVIEDELQRGKSTPLHRHPEQDEIVYVIDGEIAWLVDGEECRVGRGGVVITPRGIPHAFTVVSERARMLFVQTPGSGEAFYRGASEPAGASDGPVDFAKIGDAARRTGTTEVLAPPPFAARSR